MNKRRALLACIVAFLLSAIITLIAVFFGYFSPNIKQETDASKACDLSNLAQGNTKQCGWHMVYRRTEQDKKSISKFQHLLADPKSQASEQPETAKNQWRSENQDFFVFKPFAPVRLCGVELMAAGFIGWNPPEKEAIETLPYFTEPCESRTWDTSGRLYKREGYLSEKI